MATRTSPTVGFCPLKIFAAFILQLWLQMCVFAGPRAVSALAVGGLRASQQPVAGTVEPQVLVIEDPIANFDEIVAGNVTLAKEERKRLARIRNRHSGAADVQALSGLSPGDDTSADDDEAWSGRSPGDERSIDDDVEGDEDLFDEHERELERAREHGEVGDSSPPELEREPQDSDGNEEVTLGSAKVFFLFMTHDGLLHTDIWKIFFSQAPKGNFKVFVHCKKPNVCNVQALREAHGLRVRVVPHVKSKYCSDLVSPMVQLLASATQLSHDPNDKFVFVSDSTLPVKPFGHVYSALTQDAKSDFCFYDTTQWRRAKAPGGEDLLLLKHSQWLTLNKGHASMIVDRWTMMKNHSDSFWTVPKSEQNGQVAASTDRPVLIPKNISFCADEFAPFAMIYGPITTHFVKEKIDFQGMRDSPIQIEGWQFKAFDQGSCRTFATWGPFISGSTGIDIANKINADNKSRFTCYPCVRSFSPAGIVKISDYSLRLFRDSDFLFARKFAAGTVTEDQFRRIILSDTRPAL